MNTSQLNKIMPRASASPWLFPLNNACAEFSLVDPRRQAAFIATVAHESQQLTRVEENLNYSADGLAKTWPHRFANADRTPNTLALGIQHKPEMIANNVYADRMGNGNVLSGDGWTYRGAGAIELTGKTNQLRVAESFNIDPANIAAWLRTPDGACMSAAWFWTHVGCNIFADKGDFDGVCDVINMGRKTMKQGDAIGYTDRLNFYKVACEVLGV